MRTKRTDRVAPAIRPRRRHAFLAALSWLTLLLAGCSRQQPAPLRILCGSSMAAPMQELAAQFTRETAVPVEFDFGGSETLLPKILAGAPADVYVCHDPFEAKVKAARRWQSALTVGQLQPVVAVPAGNPGQIRSLADLQRTGLKLGMGDPRYSTCGELFVQALQRHGIREEVMKQVVLQSRSTSDVANGLMVGSLDAGVVWNFNLLLYTGKLERAAADDAFPSVRVTVVGLTGGPQPHHRDAFLAWCDRPATRETFRRHGYAEDVK
jgi:molybdate transport system substrate-binding protein